MAACSEKIIGTCERCRDEVHHQGDDVHRELELHEFLDVDVDGTAPFGNVDDGREIVVHDDHVSVFLGNLLALAGVKQSETLPSQHCS
jgi:hypothetical protein